MRILQLDRVLHGNAFQSMSLQNLKWPIPLIFLMLHLYTHTANQFSHSIKHVVLRRNIMGFESEAHQAYSPASNPALAGTSRGGYKSQSAASSRALVWNHWVTKDELSLASATAVTLRNFLSHSLPPPPLCFSLTPSACQV